MPKQKSHALIQVADGSGGMRPVADLRFDAGEWPIELVIPARDADTWMAHLNAEIEERGWSSSGLSQNRHGREPRNALRAYRWWTISPDTLHCLGKGSLCGSPRESPHRRESAIVA